MKMINKKLQQTPRGNNHFRKSRLFQLRYIKVF